MFFKSELKKILSAKIINREGGGVSSAIYRKDITTETQRKSQDTQRKTVLL